MYTYAERDIIITGKPPLKVAIAIAGYQYVNSNFGKIAVSRSAKNTLRH
jgi:hypothetical protein